MMKTLLERAEIYHIQGHYQQALQDIKDAVRYMAIERRTLHKAARFAREDFFNLFHESRVKYKSCKIEEKTLAAIERITQRPIRTDKNHQMQPEEVPQEV